MKKTLFLTTTLLLATVPGHAAVLLTAGFGNSTGTALYNPTIWQTPTPPLVSATITTQSLQTSVYTDAYDSERKLDNLTWENSTAESPLIGGNNLAGKRFTPDINIQSGNAWNTGFSINLEQSVSLSSLTVNIMALGKNPSGAPVAPSGDRKGMLGVRILQADGTVLGTVELTPFTAAKGGVNTAVTLNFGEDLTLAANQDYKMELICSRDNETGGAYIALSNMAFNGEVLPTPEPSTVSLGILGLAALAMRRRRR